MQCSTCSSSLVKRWIMLDDEKIPYHVCEKCGSVWVGARECRRLGVKVNADGIREPLDDPCPGCPSKFLDRVSLTGSFDMDAAQCGACGGLLLRITESLLKQSVDVAKDLFGSFVTDLALIQKHQRQKLKKNKLPASFSVENARETDFKCPSCEAALTLYRVFDQDKQVGADFEICDTCYGIWLDKEDLQSKVSRMDVSALEVDFESIAPGQKACPKCRDISLISMKFKSLDTVIDCCPSCFGTWLDGGELRQFCDHLGRHDYDVINTLIDNAVFRNPSLCKVLKQFSRALHDLDTQVQNQALNLVHAREIQEKLLLGQDVADAIRNHRHGNYEIAQHWQPAKEVGGDYFDLIPFQREETPYLGVCIADVSGKGLPASLLMANFQALLRSFATRNTSPRDLCAQLNRVLYQNTTPNKYITAVYGVLNLATNKFTYTNAGHEQPIHLGRRGAEFLKTGGTVLGLFPEWDFQEETIVLEAGDRLVLYTDGISEAGETREEAFKADRLSDLVLANREKRVVDLYQTLIRAVKEFCMNEFHDDATMLVLGR